MPTQDYISLTFIIVFFSVFIVVVGAIQYQSRKMLDEGKKQ